MTMDSTLGQLIAAALVLLGLALSGNIIQAEIDKHPPGMRAEHGVAGRNAHTRALLEAIEGEY